MSNPSNSKELFEALIALDRPTHFTEKEFRTEAEELSKLYKSGDGFYFHVTDLSDTFIGCPVLIFHAYLRTNPLINLIYGYKTTVRPVPD